ncbi:MAG TPA: ABC transporter permease [Flavobacteriales bacterium]|nr:ABC transporter permease [Flavobacteriales bacterium]
MESSIDKKNESWDLVIKSKTKWFNLNLGSIWKYRDLLMLLVYRDFVAVYKQTILGPLWFLIQPIITTLTFTVIFGTLANISTDGIPPILFYLSGITLWTYFADCLNKTSNTFITNANIFGKVYFPRMIVPLSVLVSNLIKLGIQILIFATVWIYYLVYSDTIHPNWSYLYLFPLLVILMAGIGLGLGILISSLTTKYRDFTFLLGFGVQLLMYATPIVYPMSIVTGKLKYILSFNPLTPVIETFKFIFLGNGDFNWMGLGYSASFMFIILFVGIVVFNRVEKSFMDTV